MITPCTKIISKYFKGAPVCWSGNLFNQIVNCTSFNYIKRGINLKNKLNKIKHKNKFYAKVKLTFTIRFGERFGLLLMRLYGEGGEHLQ